MDPTESWTQIRLMLASEAPACEAIMRALPLWFGIAESIMQYRRDLDTLETFVAEQAGQVVGFLALNHHNPSSTEIHVMAVRPEEHRRGIGRALIHHVEGILRDRGVDYLQVKTLGPSRESEEYASTRAFYRRLGFRPLEENDLWGDVNPCLIMVKHMACGGSAKTGAT